MAPVVEEQETLAWAVCLAIAATRMDIGMFWKSFDPYSVH
jgi:hypothetical protein